MFGEGIRGQLMGNNTCPHCGDRLPIVRDAFCITCGEPLDEPPERPRTPEEQAAFRAQVEEDSKGALRMILRLFGLGG
jgi:predicted amidophosphoribosyltransferase